MKKKWIIITSLIGLMAIAAVAAGPIMSDVEQPDYKVISTDKNIEMRRYAPMIIAEVSVQGKRDEAISDGFRLLADYIFGNNTVKQEIAMTAPVSQQANEKITMTAPVQQQMLGDEWKVSFVLPSQYSLETLPQPNNAEVKLIEIPEKEYLVLRYSGRISNENVALHEKELLDYASANKIETLGTAKYAFYNPPWTLPFMRRNEVMIETKAQ